MPFTRDGCARWQFTGRVATTATLGMSSGDGSSVLPQRAWRFSPQVTAGTAGGAAALERGQLDAQGIGQESMLESVTLPVDRLPVHTLVSTGPASERSPVVLVHGLALSGRYMIPTAEQLAVMRRVYVPDLPGFGDSGKPPRALDVPGLADALVSWMDAAELDRAALLGNSFGCQIIADLAARYPERVERAVLQGPTTPADERSWFWQFVRWQQNSPYNPPSMGEIAQDDYRKCGLVRALQTFQYSLLDRIEDKLPQITAPVLVVRGFLDPICNQAWAEEVTGRLPCGRLAVIPEVAHTLVYTAASELVAESRPFLEEAEHAGAALGRS